MKTASNPAPAAPGYVPDAELLQAYRHSTWAVETPAGPLRLRLDGPADPQLRPSGVVTAYNPASIPRTAAENAEADVELLRHIRSLGIPHRRTVARAPDGAWEEPGYLLHGEVRPLLVEMGLVFGQNAVVWVDAAGTPCLVCTRAGFAGRLPGQKIDL